MAFLGSLVLIIIVIIFAIIAMVVALFVMYVLPAIIYVSLISVCVVYGGIFFIAIYAMGSQDFGWALAWSAIAGTMVIGRTIGAVMAAITKRQSGGMSA